MVGAQQTAAVYIWRAIHGKIKAKFYVSSQDPLESL